MVNWNCQVLKVIRPKTKSLQMVYRGNNGEYLALEEISTSLHEVLSEDVPNSLMVLWFTEDENHLRIDHEDYQFQKDDFIFLTEFHQVEILKISKARLLKFNRGFYCIYDHDSEVGCKGLLFFGARNVPSFHLPMQEKEVFATVYHLFGLEFQRKDHLQLEMLQMMLKRILILSARIYKEDQKIDQVPNKQVDLVRDYNYLVEKHFRSHHKVADYAEILHLSPKSLANAFAKISTKSPLQFIKNRRILEAKRLLHHSDFSVKQVAYELGFEDIQSFSRFYKRETGQSPSEYAKGKIDKS